MKTNTILILLLIMMAGCDKNKPAEEDEDIKHIKLSTQIVLLGKTNTATTISILEGNAGYRIIYPKQIQIDQDDVDFSENILNLYIKDDQKIIVERKLLNEQTVSCIFLLTDKKSERRLLFIEIDQEDTYGLIRIKEIEERLLYDDNFWQW